MSPTLFLPTEEFVKAAHTKGPTITTKTNNCADTFAASLALTILPAASKLLAVKNLTNASAKFAQLSQKILIKLNPAHAEADYLNEVPVKRNYSVSKYAFENSPMRLERRQVLIS